ncbi:hypothetical protein ACRE_090560 [Hapsidospora chrysogenum ATCC 11550]|uniref:Uncharacterized protein n=1 Tax=Hapsidospora chrysogenum (strain ATCC 11550 / CBS 779.69 / DSM 880 / IAM 14645 / JCM 23072 / IMI 49137) TaxID=857340 RepID=A0A086ST53_HAPC1|nr:hypothetical protein ACRE_090560 [Hapsidospora chrysogenum ATCC 11550]
MTILPNVDSILDLRLVVTHPERFKDEETRSFAVMAGELDAASPGGIPPRSSVSSFLMQRYTASRRGGKHRPGGLETSSRTAWRGLANPTFASFDVAREPASRRLCARGLVWKPMKHVLVNVACLSTYLLTPIRARPVPHDLPPPLVVARPFMRPQHVIRPASHRSREATATPSFACLVGGAMLIDGMSAHKAGPPDVV